MGWMVVIGAELQPKDAGGTEFGAWDYQAEQFVLLKVSLFVICCLVFLFFYIVDLIIFHIF
jgi:hypothetical protein